MTVDNPPPAVALFLEGTSRSIEALQRVVSGLQRGGRRVYVFASGGARLPSLPRGGEARGGLPRAWSEHAP
jgi:hypothetical protein